MGRERRRTRSESGDTSRTARRTVRPRRSQKTGEPEGLGRKCAVDLRRIVYGYSGTVVRLRVPTVSDTQKRPGWETVGGDKTKGVGLEVERPGGQTSIYVVQLRVEAQKRVGTRKEG